MNAVALREYRSMRAAGVGGIVGEDARICLDMARARAAFMERDDVEIEWCAEEERYCDVYGDDPPEGMEYATCIVRIDGEVCAALGFVETNDRAYMRQIENELLAEAFAAE